MASKESSITAEDGSPGSQIKASIDLGTGTIKMIVARVNSSGQIQQSLYEVETPVNHGADVQRQFSLFNERRFSEEVQLQGVGVLGSYCEEAKKLGATTIVGVATEVYRTATNGKD